MKRLASCITSPLIVLNKQEILGAYTSLDKWFRTRIWIKKIAALWCLLFLCSMLVNSTLLSSLTNLAQLAVLTLLLITGFRLWDDLADKKFDQQHYPERIVGNINAATTALFYGFTGWLLLLTSLLLSYFSGVSGVIGLTLLIGFIVLVYYCLPALTPWRTLRNTLVLLKYPAMLFLLTTELMSQRPIIIAGILYVVLVTYECYDNSENTS